MKVPSHSTGELLKSGMGVESSRADGEREKVDWTRVREKERKELYS